MRVPPQLDADNEPFWRGGEHGQLLIHRCNDCGRWSHPPRAVCRHCHHRAVTPQPVSGRGTVATFTVNHQQWNPAGRTSPYVVAVVELLEQPGLRLITNIINCAVDEVVIGLPVRVVFAALDDVWLPLFEPDRGER